MTDIQDCKNLKGLRVLVIDDHPDAADLLAMVLKNHGASTQVAYGADKLDDLVTAFAPMMVLIDLGMPRVSGLEACERLRKMSAEGLFAVAVTGWADAESQMMSKQAGFDLHLVKPVNFDELAGVAESVLLKAS